MHENDTIIPVFDLGGVFVDWNPMYLFRKLFDSEDDALWFHQNICTSDWNLEFDAGEIYAEGVAKLVTRFPKYWREIKAFDERWTETFGPMIQGTIDIHNELIEQDIPTFAITNFSWEKWMTRLGEWPFLEKFDGVIVSGLENLVKPDPRIYRVFCERYGFSPDACVFIDDSEPNIVAARKFGMHGIHFKDPVHLRADLIALGLPLKAK